MTRRVRSSLIDNTTGRVLRNTDVSTANSDFVVAALAPRQVIIEVKGPGNIVQVVQATKYWKPAGPGLITKVTATLRGSSIADQTSASPGGQSLNIRVRQVKADSTTYTYSYSISADTLTTATAAQISFVETDNIYVDVLQVGSTRPGQGLVVYLENYVG